MKRSYHTDILIQYKLGLLPQEVLKQIPSSTIDHWKKRDISRYFGMDSIADYEKNLAMMKDILSRKKLLNAAKALYYIHCSYVKLFEKVKYKKSIIRQSGATIIKTIDQVKEVLGQARALKAFGISHQQYYAWKKKISCKLEPAMLCRKLNYNQLAEKEVNVIRNFLNKPEYLHWNITSVYYKILHEKAAFFSRTTFYKYVHLLKLQRGRPDKKKYLGGIRASAPKKILHADVTIIRTPDNVKLYIYLLVDNFSRFIMNWKVSREYSARIAFENIKEAYYKYDLHKVNTVVELITDGGSENKGQVENFVNRDDINMQKIIAQVDIIFSNSMVEAANKRLKYDYLFTKRFSLHTQVEPYMNFAIPDFNGKPHSALYGLTPDEAFNGMLPDKDMYKKAIKQSVLKRKLVNLAQQCNNCFGIG